MFPVFELVALGGYIFWALLGAVLVGLVAAVDKDESFIASVLTLGTLVFLTLFTTFNPFAWVWANSGLVILLAIGYVLVGIVYSGAKWVLWNYTISRKLKAYKPDWMKAQPRRDYESLADYEARFFETAKYKLNLPSDEISPRVRNNKSRIMTWMVYWPFSFVWTVLKDPFRIVYDLAYAWMGGTLQSLSDRVYRDVRMTEADK